jgi:hypothetical protein
MACRQRRTLALRCVAMSRVLTAPLHLRCGAVQCSAVRCGAVRCGAVRCGAVRCSAVRCSAVRCGAVRCGAVRCGAVPAEHSLGRKSASSRCVPAPPYCDYAPVPLTRHARSRNQTTTKARFGPLWPSSTPLFHRSPPKVIAGKRTGGRGACEERERAVEVGGAAGAGGACRAELIPSHETARVGQAGAAAECGCGGQQRSAGASQRCLHVRPTACRA